MAFGNNTFSKSMRAFMTSPSGGFGVSLSLIPLFDNHDETGPSAVTSLEAARCRACASESGCHNRARRFVFTFGMTDKAMIKNSIPEPPDLRRSMFSIAYRMLSRVADAEDIVQEAFLRLQNTWAGVGFPTTLQRRKDVAEMSIPQGFVRLIGKSGELRKKCADLTWIGTSE